MQAIARELISSNVISDVTYLGRLYKEVTNHSVEELLCPSDVFVAMQQRRQVRVAVPAELISDEGITLEHGRKSFARAAGAVTRPGKDSDMSCDLTFVPREEDRFDIREVFVESRPPDAGFLRDLRHRHRQKPMLFG